MRRRRVSQLFHVSPIKNILDTLSRTTQPRPDGTGVDPGDQRMLAIFPTLNLELETHDSVWSKAYFVRWRESYARCFVPLFSNGVRDRIGRHVSLGTPPGAVPTNWSGPRMQPNLYARAFCGVL